MRIARLFPFTLTAVITHANINTFWARVLVEELARSGVRDVVISPGSRSTPLVLAFAAHPDIEDHSVIDERSAAFHALGIAKASRRPVALLCTSGTAAANYLPALCEADAAHVPLIVCTADRPTELRHSGAPQTMDQAGLYGNRARYFHDLPQAEADRAKLRALRAIVCHAVARALGPLPGPVHLNIPFRKPLEPLPPERSFDALPPDWTDSVEEEVAGRRDGRAWTSTMHWGNSAHSEALRFQLLDLLLRAQRPLILAGPHTPDDGYRDALLAFAEEHSVPVLAEAASNVRYGPPSPLVFGSSDLLLRSGVFRSRVKPDLLVQIGSAPTNSAMQRFIDELDDVPFVVLTPTADRADPSHRATLHVIGQPCAIIGDLATAMRNYPPAGRDTDWLPMFRDADAAARSGLDTALAGIEESFEGKVFARLRSLLPVDGALFLSSSMPIRDAETFLAVSEKDTAVFFNRGVNGIDGILSTALGVARERPCVLVTGDVAVLHNLNALAGEGLRALKLTVVLLNNSGGEIFELLPVRDFEPAFTKHFVTPHSTNFPALFTAFGVKHTVAQSWEHFDGSFREALRHDGVAVIEVRTEIRSSGELRRAVLRDVAEVVDAAMKGHSRQPSDLRIPFPLSWNDHGGEGLPVVLLHGFTRDASSWRALHRALGARRIITIDLMGHGASPSPAYERFPETWTLDGAAMRIEDVLKTLGIARAHIVGYSLGARTALTFALGYPKRLASLALLSGNPGMEDAAMRSARSQQDAQLAETILTDGLARFVQAWSIAPLFEAQRYAHPSAWRKAVAERRKGCSRGFASSLRGSGQGAQESMWKQLAELACPVFAAAGTQDPVYADVARRIASEKEAELCLFENCGHDLPLEQPIALALALTTFWTGVENRQP
ncbi:MAG: 2-succinyl-5-enolpyruvyl-6-hydroxy-3-cyclohexene-1-carboxylic-acid synthase [Bacteroidia bacterium]|nr:2-succinyl-5-enolpyruvyl-6-hydroxy-3-cyclohexene-1-carboxylic-acid synthase [Bacteroidia bacterium]